MSFNKLRRLISPHFSFPRLWRYKSLDVWASVSVGFGYLSKPESQKHRSIGSNPMPLLLCTPRPDFTFRLLS